MKSQKLVDLDNDALVAQFVAAAKQRGLAVLNHEIRKANRIFQIMWDIDLVLRSRGKEARLRLVPLLDDKDRFVRYFAAKKLLGLVPDRARVGIEGIADPKFDALSGDAGMCLYALDEGIFKPD